LEVSPKHQVNKTFFLKVFLFLWQVNVCLTGQNDSLLKPAVILHNQVAEALPAAMYQKLMPGQYRRSAGQ